MQPPALSVVVDCGGAVDLITVAGDLDVCEVEQLREPALSHLASCGGLVLDLRDVTFIDSAGLHTLVRLRRHALLLGAELALARPSHRTLRLLDLTGTLALFDTFPGVESARAELRRRRAAAGRRW